MEPFILKLAVAIIPLVVLGASISIITNLTSWYTCHPLAWHRKRRDMLRAIAGGVMLR